ncbi:MAG TPA: amino acid adenylation domain-containing protein [Polyangiales bacterium]
MTLATNLVSAFFATAAATPEHDALVFSDHSLRYEQLQARVQRLRAAVDAQTDGPCCGLLAQRSETAFAGVLAILAAGCAYVPLNVAFPASRNRYIAEKAGLRTLIVGPECVPALRALLAATTARYRVVTLEHDPALAELARELPERVLWELAPDACDHPPVQVAPNAPAYVLFTSGSTGQPKGVVVRHRNVQRYVESFLSTYPIGPEDRLTQTFDLTFDLSVHDMFITWSAGATLVVYDAAALAAPVAHARDQRVTVWFSVPSLAALLESQRQLEPGALPELRLSLFCGEKLTWNTWRTWSSIAPQSRVVNLYGPTETTIAITHFEVPRDFPEAAALHGTIPIGCALPGQSVQVRRDDGSACETDEAGALWLSGDQLTAGYLGEPELTAARFVATDSGLWYRTGDVVVLDARGQLQFLGREDSQVKIMGYRVELGEIEHALLKASGAAQVLCDVAVLRNGVEELFAVLPEQVGAQKRAIRDELKRLLPSYMWPRQYFFVNSFPCNASGKLDRRALRERIVNTRPPQS